MTLSGPEMEKAEGNLEFWMKALVSCHSEEH